MPMHGSHGAKISFAVTITAMSHNSDMLKIGCELGVHRSW